MARSWQRGRGCRLWERNCKNLTHRFYSQPSACASLCPFYSSTLDSPDVGAGPRADPSIKSHQASSHVASVVGENEPVFVDAGMAGSNLWERIKKCSYEFEIAHHRLSRTKAFFLTLTHSACFHNARR